MTTRPGTPAATRPAVRLGEKYNTAASRGRKKPRRPSKDTSGGASAAPPDEQRRRPGCRAAKPKPIRWKAEARARPRIRSAVPDAARWRRVTCEAGVYRRPNVDRGSRQTGAVRHASRALFARVPCQNQSSFIVRTPRAVQNGRTAHPPHSALPARVPHDHADLKLGAARAASQFREGSRARQSGRAARATAAVPSSCARRKTFSTAARWYRGPSSVNSTERGLPSPPTPMFATRSLVSRPILAGLAQMFLGDGWDRTTLNGRHAILSKYDAAISTSCRISRRSASMCWESRQHRKVAAFETRARCSPTCGSSVESSRPHMPLGPGFRIGPYEIVALLGAGGMGEVYRARDARLKRDVALKFLPEAVAADPERLARFEREAQALAALNHPHIATIHGIEEAPSTGRAVQFAARAGRSRRNVADGSRAALAGPAAVAIASQIVDA